MINKYLYLFLYYTLIILVCIFPSAFAHATSFSITDDPNAPDTIIQGDAIGALDFTIKGDKSNKDDIDKVRFEFPASDYTVCSFTAPDNWTAVINPANVIEFQTSSSSAAIGKNEERTFSIVVTGPEGNIPRASADDSSHKLTSVQAWDDDNDKCTFTGGAINWKRIGLYTEMFIDPTTLMRNQTAKFYISVQNRTSAQQTVTPILPSIFTEGGIYSFRGRWSRRQPSTGSMTYESGPSPLSQTLEPGEIKEFIYTYTATKEGNVTYKSGSQGAGVTSNACISNEVSIQALGGWLDVPLSVGNGEAFPVAFHVVNNSTDPITQIEPNSLNAIEGTDTNSLDRIDGPNPPGPIASISPGAEIIFYWTYRAYGDPGAQFRFSGSVTSDNSTRTNRTSTTRDQTNWSTITTFSATVQPDIVSMNENIEFIFTIFNGSTRTGDYIKQITIYHPDSEFTDNFFSTVNEPNPAWKRTDIADGCVFNPVSGSGLGRQSSTTVSLSYKIPQYPSEIPKIFLLTLSGTVNNSPLAENKTCSITVSQRSLEISVTPQNTLLNSPYDADGVGLFDVKARLMRGDTPLVGKNVSFTTTVPPTLDLSIPPQIEPLTATTNSLGFACVTLTAPRYEKSNPSEFNLTLTAAYQNLVSVYPDLRFKYCTKPTFKLVQLEARRGSGNYEDVATFEFIPGENNITFRPKIEIIGSGNISIRTYEIKNNVTRYTSFSFTDSDNNGTTLYSSTLNSQTNEDDLVVLRFNSGQIPPGMIYGHYAPDITLQYRINNTPQEEFILKATDADHKIRIGSKNQGIKIINWREKQESVN